DFTDDRGVLLTRGGCPHERRVSRRTIKGKACLQARGRSGGGADVRHLDGVREVRTEGGGRWVGGEDPNRKIGLRFDANVDSTCAATARAVGHHGLNGPWERAR